MNLFRLIAAPLLLLTASLAVFRAPTHLLWMVAVVLTEWGHAVALICVFVAILLAGKTWQGLIAVSLCIMAAALTLTPLIRAEAFAREVPKQLNRAFGSVVFADPPPLVFTNLWRGMAFPEIVPQTLTYSSAGDFLSLDFYHLGSSLAPLVVVIHGGSWNSGDNKDFISFDRFLAARGYAVADVLYRLAPHSRFPAASADVVSAIRFLRDSASTLKVDANRIVLLGRSAGGQIALHVAYTAGDPAIRGVISFYAPTDMNWSWENPGNPLVIDTRSVLVDYLGGRPSEFPESYTAGSPVRVANSKSPPTLLFYGGRDELVSPRHGEMLSRRLTDLGVPNLNLSLPWATHGFDYVPHGPGGQISTYAIEWFLKAILS